MAKDKKLSSKKTVAKEVTVTKPVKSDNVPQTTAIDEKPEIKPNEKLKQETKTLLNEPIEIPEVKTKKVKKKPMKKLIQTGKEGEADFVDETAEKLLNGSSMGMYAGIAIGILLTSVGIYYVYTKIKGKSKPKEVDVTDIVKVENIKPVEVKKIET